MKAVLILWAVILIPACWFFGRLLRRRRLELEAGEADRKRRRDHYLRSGLHSDHWGP